MKKYIISAILFFIVASSFSQTTQRRLGIDSASGNPILYKDTIIGNGTAGQHLVGGTIPHWVDTAAVGGSGWGVTGNSGIDTAVNFLGTTDSKGIVFRTNNTYRGMFTPGGHLLLNTKTDQTSRDLVIGSSASGALYVGDISFYNSGGTRIMNSGGGTTIDYNTGATKNGQFGSSLYWKNQLGVTSSFFGMDVAMKNTLTTAITNGTGEEIYFSPLNSSNNNYAVIRGADGTFGSTGWLSHIMLFPGKNTTTNNYGNIILNHDGTNKRGNLLVGTLNSYPSAIVNIESTTQAFLKPRMTSVQRDSITKGVGTGTIVGGSGYGATALYLDKALTGGSGSGATADIQVTTASVTGVTIKISGYGYAVGDVLSATIGTGTGFTFTITSTGIAGSKIYNTTTNQENTFNGINWQNDYISSSAGTLTITHGSDNTFTGTTSTWTLPAPSSTLLGRQNSIIIVNLGSGSITLNSASGSQIIPTASTTAQASLTITTGQSCQLFPTGTAFKVLYVN